MTSRPDAPYPRPLTARERAWLEWILPADRPGYAAFRASIEGLQIIGQGRRGEGEVVLGPSGAAPDLEPPLGAVFSYGAIETNFGTISVTVREPVEGQASLEIVSHRADRVPDEFEEARRWTYARWNPGEACPQCAHPPREVAMRAGAGERLVLAVCVADRRLWVHSSASLVNRLIPVTNFYNEIMLHKNIRDPKIALDSRRLFADLGSFTDGDLARAFETYNALKTKVHVDGPVRPEGAPSTGVLATLKKLLAR
jgi:mono/diheme cytochrome c family protein